MYGVHLPLLLCCLTCLLTTNTPSLQLAAVSLPLPSAHLSHSLPLSEAGEERRGGGGEFLDRSIMVMMDGSLDAEKIAGYFKGKSILITGATGFLGKSKYTHTHQSSV